MGGPTTQPLCSDKRWGILGWPGADERDVQRLAELAELLGFDVHVQTDYGDEMAGLTPWELFDEADASEALAMAEEAVALARKVLEVLLKKGPAGGQ